MSRENWPHQLAVVGGLLTGVIALVAGAFALDRRNGPPPIEAWPLLATAALAFGLVAIATWRR